MTKDDKCVETSYRICLNAYWEGDDTRFRTEQFGSSEVGSVFTANAKCKASPDEGGFGFGS